MMKKKYYVVLLLSILIGIAGCSSKTRTVSLGYSLKKDAQIEKAKAAYSQKKYTEAAKLLKPLAEQGESYAQYALGYMYYNGLGVPRDHTRANQLLDASASNGNKNAIEALRLIATASSTAKSDMAASSSSSADINVVKETARQPVDKPASPAASEIPEVPEMKMSPTSDSPQMLPEEKIDEPVIESSEQNQVRLSDMTDPEKWIVSQPDENYTIQLMISGNESAMQQYIIDNNLQDNAVYYKTRRNSSDLYVLIQGSYDSFSQATKTISQYSPTIKKANPWVREFSAVKKSLSVQ